MFKRPTVLIVDAVSTGRLLPQEFKKYGYQSIHVHSDGEQTDQFKPHFIPGNFEADLAYRGDFDQAVEWASQFNLKFVVPGAEPGVLLADELAQALHSEFGVPSNGVLKARRDKGSLPEVLAPKGIEVALQMAPQSWQELRSWVEANDLFPGIVVLKPRMSAGTNGLFFNHSLEQLRENYEKLLLSKDVFGKPVQVLAQEYLDGREYAVQTVSRDGKHVITDIWFYEKTEIQGGGAIYEEDWLMPYEGIGEEILAPYTFRVLDALGVKTGWGHSEIKLTRRGPRLVDFGNRMMGSSQPRLTAEAIGEGQIEIGVEAFANPSAFMRRPVAYKYRQPAVLITFNSQIDGTRLNRALETELMKLPGYVRHSFFYPDGASLPKTVDMETSFGQVELTHPDVNVLKQSVTAIRRWKRQAAFQTTP